MTTWFTSDNHYYHKNVMKYSNRPFNSVEEMNESMIEQHNDVVDENDTVWFLGDFGFASPLKIENILKRLKGNKFLILGNHDRQFRKNRKRFLHDDMFKGIYDYKEINVGKQPIMLFHYGMRIWNRSHHGTWLLYGHSHGRLPPYGKSLDVGVDDKHISDDYRPYSFEEIKTFMDSRKIENAEERD